MTTRTARGVADMAIGVADPNHTTATCRVAEKVVAELIDYEYLPADVEIEATNVVAEALRRHDGRNEAGASVRAVIAVTALTEAGLLR